VDTPIDGQRRTDILHYIKCLPTYLDQLLQDYPTKIRQHKVNVAELFASKLHRQLMLNRLAITSAHILSQSALLEAMYREWAVLDLGDILDQTLWISDCRKEDMEQICKRINQTHPMPTDHSPFLSIVRRDIPHLLTVGSTLAPWMAWEEKLIDMFVPRFLQVKLINPVLMHDPHTTCPYRTKTWPRCMYPKPNNLCSNGRCIRALCFNSSLSKIFPV
jgi:hypothetical protein